MQLTRKCDSSHTRTSSVRRRSAPVSPIPHKTPVVNGTRSCPLSSSCASHRVGSFDGEACPTPYGPCIVRRSAYSRRELCSSMRPIDAFSGASAAISSRESGPALVCGSKPCCRANAHTDVMRSSHATRRSDRMRPTRVHLPTQHQDIGASLSTRDSRETQARLNRRQELFKRALDSLVSSEETRETVSRLNHCTPPASNLAPRRRTTCKTCPYFTWQFWIWFPHQEAPFSAAIAHTVRKFGMTI